MLKFITAILLFLMMGFNSLLGQKTIYFIKYSCEGDSIEIIGEEKYNQSNQIIKKLETFPVNYFSAFVYNSEGKLIEEKIEYPTEKRLIQHYYSYNEQLDRWAKDSIVTNEFQNYDIIDRISLSDTKDVLKSKFNPIEVTINYDENGNVIYKTICTAIQNCTTYKFNYENGNTMLEEIWKLNEDSQVPFLINRTNHIYNQNNYLGSVVLNADERCLYQIKKVIQTP